MSNIVVILLMIGSVTAVLAALVFMDYIELKIKKRNIKAVMEDPPHVCTWLPTVNGTNFISYNEIHCDGCGKFMHKRGNGYVPGRDPNRHKCVQPIRKIVT